MSGLDKMKARILEEAEGSAREILDNACREADGILETAEKEAQTGADALIAKAQREADDYEKRTVSAADMERKRQLLAARQEIINEILDRAYEKVRDLDEKEYFEIMGKLLEKYVQPEAGAICFSGKDLKRMPEEFREKIRKTAGEKGGSLTLSEEPGQMEAGFLLIYGGIEENCTLKAVFREKREVLSDLVNGILFGNGTHKEGRS